MAVVSQIVVATLAHVVGIQRLVHIGAALRLVHADDVIARLADVRRAAAGVGVYRPPRVLVAHTRPTCHMTTICHIYMYVFFMSTN